MQARTWGSQAAKKVVLERWSGHLQKGRAGVLGFCPQVPSVMRRGAPSVAENNRFKVPKPDRGLES